MPDSTRKDFPDTDDRALLATLIVRMEMLCEKVDKIEEHLEKEMVTQHEFRPVASIAYGIIAISMTALLVGVLGLVLRS